MRPKQLKRLSVQQFEVAIIGGGLVGASLARALAKSQIKTVVIDNQPASALYTESLDNRGLALSYLSTQILNKINIWDNLVERAFSIQQVHVSEQGSFGFTKLRADKYGLPALGYVVSASVLGKSLICDLDQAAGISVMRPAKIDSLNLNNENPGWILSVDNKQIHADLVVAADGSDSFLRTQQNISINTKDFAQTAIVTNVLSQEQHHNIAYERFTPHGVLALLPFGNKKLKCVWTVDNIYLTELSECSDHEFLQTIQSAIGFRLGKLISVEPRKTFPIRQICAQKITGDSCVLVGNAANTLHPVAAQGFNLGLRDIDCLAQLLSKAKHDNTSLNNKEILHKYATQRSSDHLSTQNYTGKIVDLFGSDTQLVKLTRRIGLVASQIVPGLNKRLTAQGLGVCK